MQRAQTPTAMPSYLVQRAQTRTFMVNAFVFSTFLQRQSLPPSCKKAALGLENPGANKTYKIHQITWHKIQYLIHSTRS